MSIAVLVGLPMMLGRSGVGNSPLSSVFSVAGVFLALGTFHRFVFGLRLGKCRAVLRNYPLEFQPRVVRKKADDWTKYGTFFTVGISGGGPERMPFMRAVNVVGRRRWPKEVESGAWFAGDVAFGAVLVAPGSEEVLFLEIAKRDKAVRARQKAGPDRRALAVRAGLVRKRALER
ncbi:hypothetical protein ACH4FX_19145 [Streptomyces sp. NPDC018019]|uniref:hypothetical protein n=1 Tax=Streptomyces sp. NPDC018019 TaxID=3365030 RepID=UPI0037A44B76